MKTLTNCRQAKKISYSDIKEDNLITLFGLVFKVIKKEIDFTERESFWCLSPVGHLGDKLELNNVFNKDTVECKNNAWFYRVLTKPDDEFYVGINTEYSVDCAISEIDRHGRVWFKKRRDLKRAINDSVDLVNKEYVPKSVYFGYLLREVNSDQKNALSNIIKDAFKKHYKCRKVKIVIDCGRWEYSEAHMNINVFCDTRTSKVLTLSIPISVKEDYLSIASDEKLTSLALTELLKILLNNSISNLENHV